MIKIGGASDMQVPPKKRLYLPEWLLAKSPPGRESCQRRLEYLLSMGHPNYSLKLRTTYK